MKDLPFWQLQLGQPLPTISAPMTPQNHLQSSQQLSKDPRQTQSQLPAVQNRHADSRLHRTIPSQQRPFDVQGPAQLTENGSANSEANVSGGSTHLKTNRPSPQEREVFKTRAKNS